MSKGTIRVFISYSQRNKETANDFLTRFKEYASISKKYDYSFWWDEKIMTGQTWEEHIQSKIASSDVHLLLVSPSFLNSNYIKQHELPAIKAVNKLIIPVGLAKIDLERHDLQGLERLQIFRLSSKGLDGPKFYSDLKAKRKVEFVDLLFIQLEDHLNYWFDM